MDKFDEYKKAALIGLLSGISFNSDCDVTDDDLEYLNLLCVRIANKMIKD